MYLNGGKPPAVVASSSEAGPLQAVVLMVGSCLPVLGTVLIAPVLPRIQEDFSTVPQVEILAPLALTIPALFIGLIAPVAGVLADVFGRKRLLVFAMILYGVFGTAPLWLDNLPAIILSRAGVGITEAAIMTCCTALIADYFDGVKREQYLALQTVWTTSAAMLFLFVGGFLGGFGWRVPFWLYFSSFAVAVVMYRVLFEPKKVTKNMSTDDRRDFQPSGRWVWAKLSYICAVTFLGAIAFFTVQVELGFLLNQMGINSTQLIGTAIALGAAMVMVGALLTRRLHSLGVPLLLTIGFSLAGAGFVTMGSAVSYSGIVFGVLIHGLGAGFLLPTLVTWAMRILSFEQRGRGSGAWNSSFFLGQFACPFVVLAAITKTGTLGVAIVAIGWTLVGIASVGLLVFFIRAFQFFTRGVDTSWVP